MKYFVLPPLTSLSLWDHFCFMGICEVERIVAKRVKGGKSEYFIQLQNYCSSENTWEPAEHLPQDLIAAFENRYVDPLRADECRERLALLFEKDLKSPTACNETITMQHNVLRAMFPGLPSDIRGSPYPANREELITAGLGSSLRKCLTVSRRHSNQLEAVSWQVTYLLRWARPQNSFSPSGESSDQVHEKLFRWTHPVSEMLLL